MAFDLEAVMASHQGLGPIDCDIHPAVPSTEVLLPYMDPYWQEHLTVRGLHRTVLNLSSYPPNAPTTIRADWKSVRPCPNADLDTLRTQALDGFGSSFAICNPLYGANGLHGDDLVAALCRATNDWIVAEWLDREPRLRASVVVPLDNPELAVEEIERRAADPRFVQVLLLAQAGQPLGRRAYWPIYRAAERHRMTVGIHAGATYRQVPSASGWTSYYLEDWVMTAPACETQLMSLLAEGVFETFPDLTVVFMESGFMWLPPMIWRANKTWRGVRAEVPWIQRAPGEIIRERARFTLQPLDMPPEAAMLEKTIEQIGTDAFLLYSTDYPHWHFDGDAVAPPDFPADLLRKAAVENPLRAYPRLCGRVIEETRQ